MPPSAVSATAATSTMNGNQQEDNTMKQFKQFLFSALALLASLFAGTSCMDDLANEIVVQPDGSKLISYSLKVNGLKDTKVTIDGDNRLTFDPTDKLIITSEDGTLSGELTIPPEKYGKYTSTFSGTLHYTGSDPVPPATLKLTARLVTEAIPETFKGGLSTSKVDAVSRFSMLTKEFTYGTTSFTLEQGTAFFKFIFTVDPAPAYVEGGYTAVLSNNNEELASAQVSFTGGVTTFYGALPGNVALSHAKVTLCGHDFKFAGTIEASQLYTVSRSYYDMRETPLTFERVHSYPTTINVNNPLGKTFYWTFDNDKTIVWQNPTDVGQFSIEFGDHQTIQLYGNNDQYARSDINFLNPDTYTSIRCTADCHIYGNIMSLVQPADTPTASITDPSNFKDLVVLPQSGFATFGLLFMEATAHTEGKEKYLVPPETYHFLNDPQRDILLPATTLAPGCYYGLFAFTGINRAPELPARELALYCYTQMFWACPYLLSVPSSLLPATTLAQQCYSGMFSYSNLKYAPDLPATVMVDGCYESMFNQCPELISVPSVLPAETLADDCYSMMFYYCEKLSSFTNSMGIPSEIKAKTAGARSCSEMFHGCSSLTVAPEIQITTLSGEGCLAEMFKGCSSLTTPPSTLFLSTTTLTSDCCSEMFRNCRNLTTSPILPAKNLASGCYSSMFRGCSSLNHIECLATDISADDCTTNWTEGVATEGTFVRDGNMTAWTRGDDGIPTNWIVDPPMDAPDASTPLTLKAAGTCTITIKNPLNKKIYFLKEGGELENSELSTISIALTAGQSVQLYGKNTTYAAADAIPVFDENRNDDIRLLNDNSYTNITFSSRCSIYGNIMSLVLPTDTPDESITNPANFKDLKELPAGTNTFAGLFLDQEAFDEGPTLRLRNDENRDILLPATTLTSGCYYSLFLGSGLKRVPELPAVNLAADCYGTMFAANYNIESVPSSLLKAETMQPHCYEAMFLYCLNLQNTPDLPATTTAEGCYSFMFAVCGTLTNGPSAFAAKELADFSCNYMFMSCESLSGFPTIEAETVGRFSCAYMFNNCTSLVTAPEIRATNLKYMDEYDRDKHGCFEGMFYDCTHLTTPPPVLPATKLRNSCYASMFKGCTSLTAAPELPAETLERRCYVGMFEGCSNLNYIKCMAIIPAAIDGSFSGTSHWTKDVSATGTFVRNQNMQDWTRGNDGIPAGWTIEPPVTTVGEFSVGKDASDNPKKVVFAPGNLYVENGNELIEDWNCSFDDFSHSVRHPDNQDWSSELPSSRNLVTWNEIGGFLDGTSKYDDHFEGADIDYTITGTRAIGVYRWRLLTQSEWFYLLGDAAGESTACRPNAHSLRGPCTIGGIFGLLIAPDDYTESLPTTATTIPEGCVFLPACGTKTDNTEGKVKVVNSCGFYHSASTDQANFSADCVTEFYFENGVFYVNPGVHPGGSAWKSSEYNSVRLVRDVN